MNIFKRMMNNNIDRNKLDLKPCHFLSPVTPEAKKAIEKAVKHSVKKYKKTYQMLADERLKITPKDKKLLKENE